MPGITEYPMEKPETLDELANEEMEQRRKAIDAAWRYYEGNHRRPLKVEPGQPDDNVILNVCRKAIEQAVALLFGEATERLFGLDVVLRTHVFLLDTADLSRVGHLGP